MSLGILTNVAATYAQNNLNQTQGSLQTVLQQLSSGSRINSGADDAAGLSVADGLRANQAALNQSAQNAQNGVGLLQTADGAFHSLVKSDLRSMEHQPRSLMPADYGTSLSPAEIDDIVSYLMKVGRAHPERNPVKKDN